MRKLFLVIFLFASFFLLTVNKVSSVSLEECEKDPSRDVNECIKLFSERIDELGDQKKTLASQIAQFDTQIKVTQLKISEAQNTIEKLEKEIGILGFRIGYVSQSIDRLENLVKKRIVATYQQSFISNLELILASNDFSDLILKLQYLKQVQENDKRILASLQQTRSNYANQKDEREVKQAAIEENKNKLEVLRVDLDSQKAEKEEFLTITKNDESRYQALLAQAQAERAIVFGGGTDVFMRDIKQGEGIGTIASYNASPGCSSGPHLHLEVHKNGSVHDPNNYLKGVNFSYNYPPEKQSIYGTINPQGDLPWPLSEPIGVNQGFGAQKNSSFYGPAGHQGIDIQTGSGNATGQTVKAIKDGKLYGGSYNCSGKLYYAKIEHDDGLVTWYLHMVPQ